MKRSEEIRRKINSLQSDMEQAVEDENDGHQEELNKQIDDLYYELENLE